MDELRKYLKNLEDDGFIDENGKPLKCIHCVSGREYLEDINESYGPVGLEEFEVRCNICNKVTGHWAYGNWQID